MYDGFTVAYRGIYREDVNEAQRKREAEEGPYLIVFVPTNEEDKGPFKMIVHDPQATHDEPDSMVFQRTTAVAMRNLIRHMPYVFKHP